MTIPHRVWYDAKRKERNDIAELVIKISEEKLNIIKNKLYCGIYDPDLYKAIENGIVLPKGHGDLIDVDDIRVIELEDSLHIIRHEKGDEIDVYIDASTIIEADKGDE